MSDSNPLILEAEEHYRRGRLDAAAKTYAAVLEAEPENVEAMEWRGEIAVQQDDYDLAATLLAKARMLRGDDSFTEYTNLGLCYYELNQPVEAVETLWQALAYDPDDLVSHSNLGKALYDLHANGGAKDAVRIATEWHQKFPDIPDARHIGAAISRIAVPEAANAAYVADIFNDYAPIFEEKLAELDYAAPALIQAALSGVIAQAPATLTVLDAGCGTGLCAPFLRPWAAVLDGVDLSPGMLDKARERAVYNALEEADLVTFCRQRPVRYDLIVAADVLCYIGELSAAMTQFFGALTPAGTLAFSVETLQAPEGYTLDPSGRYKHDPEYICQCLESAGLIIRQTQDAVLRSEYGVPVSGMVVVAQKPR